MRSLLKFRHLTLIASVINVVIGLGIVAITYRGLDDVSSFDRSAILAGVSLIVALSVIVFFVSARVSRAIGGFADTIEDAARGIAATVDQRERLGAQQAAATNETTTAMEELAASARQSSEQAQSLAAGARQVVSLADEGASSVKQSLKGMDSLKAKVHTIAGKILQLSEQASQIGNITNLVTDVASQTNMLALNAAVEAARAGDQGKGFSVVAVEIRKLADQTRKSAQKINTLVDDIMKAINSTVMATEDGTKTVDEGVTIANRTVQSFVGVRDAISKASENTQQISLNAQQQSLAVNEVLRAMSDLSAESREIAASVIQGKDRAEKLRLAAIELGAM